MYTRTGSTLIRYLQRLKGNFYIHDQSFFCSRITPWAFKLCIRTKKSYVVISGSLIAVLKMRTINLMTN